MATLNFFFQAYLHLSYITPKTSIMSWKRKGVNYDRKVCVSSEYGYCNNKKKRIEFITHAVQSIKPVVMLVDSKVSLTWKLLVVNDPWCTFGLFTAIIPFLGTRL